MLHIVQAVIWGVAESPRIFRDAEQARAAFVDCTRQKWGQRYGAYCEHNGLPGGSFDSAQAFVNSLDVSEKSSVHFWSLAVEEGDGGITQPEFGRDDREIGQLSKKISLIENGLAQLLDVIVLLAANYAANAPGVTAKECDSDKPQELPEQKMEAAPETYATREWQEFAATIKHQLCGSRNQSELFPRDGWRQAVYSRQTSLEYWDWVADRAKRSKENAQHAGFVVYAEPGILGSFKYAGREGETSQENFSSEWEAWCAAGMHLAAASN